MTDFANLVLGVNTSQLKSGERDLKQFGAQSDRTSGKVDKFGGSAKRSFNAVAIAATAALGAIVSIGSAVRIIADFETSMSRLGAVSRATSGELEELRDIAKGLGSTTEFSASQAADGLNFLAMAGFNATEAMAAIPSVLDLATASGMGLAAAADTASNIMSGFGIEANNAAQVADVLAAASTRANTTVGQLGAAMSTVAPIAKALDMSLEDTAAAIGVMSDAGIQGERAGTALRGVLASLAGPTTQAETVIKGLGLTIADVDPAANDLSDVMAKLGAAGLSTADAMALFGREAASGALVLIDGAQRVGDFGDELARADGAAGDMAATMRDNLGGDLKGAMSAAQGLAIALGDAGLTAVIRGVVQGVTATVRGVSAAVDAIGELRGFAIAAALALTAIYTPAIIAGTVATASWIAALVTLKVALIATGVGALVVIVGLLINKLIEARTMTQSFGTAFKMIGLQVKSAALNMQAWFISALGSMAYQFVEFTWTVADGLNSLFGSNLMGADATITQQMNMSFIETKAAADAAAAAAAALGTELNNVPDAITTTQTTLAELDAANGSGGSGGAGAGAMDQQKNEDLAERDRILESLKTDQEKYNDALAQANRLLAANVLPSEAYAQHVAQLRQELTDAEWADSGLKPFIDDLSQAGLSMESLADVFQNAIARMAQSWLSSGLTSLGQSFMGIGGGAQGGGIISGLIAGLPSFSGGGSTGSGSRSGGLDGQGGFAAMLHPQETVTDHTRGQSSSQAPVINITVNGARGNAEIVEMVGIGVSAGIQQNNKRIATAQGRPT